MNGEEEVFTTLEYVRIDSSVLMKISKHQKDGLRPLGLGQLLGKIEDTYVEITECYPQLYNDDSMSEVRSWFTQNRISEYESLVSNYNSEFNIPQVKVGWYLISDSHSFLSSECFLNNYGFYEKGINPVFLVYDEERARAGAQCPFRAFKMADEWLKDIYRDDHNQLIIDNKMYCNI